MTHSTSIVIFGASGDLTQRMIVPALYSLYRKQRLPKPTRIVGYAITEYDSDDAFRDHLREAMHEFAPQGFDADAWEDFAKRLHYVSGNFTHGEDFKALDARLKKLEGGPANRIYYLATAPQFFTVIPDQLHQAGMAHAEDGYRRVVVEKPFGSDLESAKAVNRDLHTVFDENQIYRIDHFLGKETAQNILFFRFANTLFELGWNRNYIANVQITVTETVDVAHRGPYFDKAGVLRDMFQNHLLQLLALMAMEPPASFEANAVRNEKVKLLSTLRPIAPEETAQYTARGQYRGYRQAEGVAPDSTTATYAALRVFIDNWRWQDVPFYLRSGKALNEKNTQINVVFRRPPHVMFPLPKGQHITPNVLSLCIEPDEGIHFNFQAKVPDTEAEMQTVEMDFDYDKRSIPDAYERLLLDVIEGDPSLFTRHDGIEAAWRFIDPILEGWQRPDAPELETYEVGSPGPRSADALLAADGHRWRLACRSG